MDLMQQFANPETIESLSLGERMQASALTMLVGLGITFMVLVIIWAFIVIMGAIVKRSRLAKLKAQQMVTLVPAYENMDGEDVRKRPVKPSNVSKNVSSKAAGFAKVVGIEEPKAKEDETANEQLVAVISAAIAAFEGENVSNLVVTKITRRPNNQTPWTVAGLNERMETRKTL